MKLITWNVNGIRACSKNGFSKWFEANSADVICLQEIKATPEQLEDDLKNLLKYNSYWNPAEKKGYSGTAIYSKKEPLSIRVGMGLNEFDSEGRVLTAEFKDFFMVNAYFPNSQRDHARLGYKLDFCDAMLKFCNKLQKEGKNVVLCGDFNIAHTEIDLKNPKTNMDNAGFLPEERAWMTEFLTAGYVDSFRHFNKDPENYTWWSYRPGVREKNIGWRLDYHCVNDDFKDRIKATTHQTKIKGSDHCPVLLELRD